MSSASAQGSMRSRGAKADVRAAARYYEKDTLTTTTLSPALLAARMISATVAYCVLGATERKRFNMIYRRLQNLIVSAVVKRESAAQASSKARVTRNGKRKSRAKSSVDD
jgi:hypothetical protein